MYFWLNYCDENQIERILIAWENVGHIFHLASEIIEADRFHLFLLFDGTWIDDNEYLSSLENGTELIFLHRCRQKCPIQDQIQTLLLYFELKRYLRPKKSLIL